MLKVKLEEIIRTYSKIKKLAYKNFVENNFEKSLDQISIAATIAYKFNWIYTDQELEKLLKDISIKVIKQKEFSPKKGKIVFYDFSCSPNRALTQQYIRAFISWDAELLYIFEGDKISSDNKIIKELRAYPKAEILVANDSSEVDKMILFYQRIVEFQPEMAFLQLHPSSSMAVALWNALPQTTRYQVNLTDHAFWLGTSCTDYCLEFRNYGYTVSLEKRGLSREQLLIQKFFPITDCVPFQGFPPEVSEDSIVIFTGGSFYKMYGEDDKFFKIIKQLLEIDRKVIVLIAGDGGAGPIKKFISKNKLQTRVVLIGNRSDINYVFKACDIYLSTFPLTGGLMGQFAAINKKPILSYTTENIPSNFTEGFFNCENTDWKVTHTHIRSFLEEAKELIQNVEYRHQRGAEAYPNLITEKEFNDNLKQLTNTLVNSYKPKVEKIDYDKFTSLYLDCENNYTPSFYSLIIARFKLKSFLLFPKIGFKAVFSGSVYKKIIKKIKNL